MKSIHKFPLEILGSQRIQIQPGYRPLCIQLQDGIPTLWALVDTHREPRSHMVYMFGTGQPMSDIPSYQYLGTVQMQNLVWHFFTVEGE